VPDVPRRERRDDQQQRGGRANSDPHGLTELGLGSLGSTYVVLAFDGHDNFSALVARAQQRAVQFAGPPLEWR